MGSPRFDLSRALALTICNPYPHLIAIGEKPIENREWRGPTSYRGPLLIHAGKSRAWLSDGDETRYPGMAFSAIVAVANLADCLHIDASWPPALEHLRGHEHCHGPWCLVLQDVYRLPSPVPCGGFQKLWRPAPHIVAAVSEQLQAAA